MLSVFCASGEKTFIMSVYCLVQQQLETILILVGEEDERERGGPQPTIRVSAGGLGVSLDLSVSWQVL